MINAKKQKIWHGIAGIGKERAKVAQDAGIKSVEHGKCVREQRM